MDPNRALSPLGRLTGAVALALAGLLFAPAAHASSTAANTKITNTASVAYQDAGGIGQTPVTASVDVTVNLVQAAPTISATGTIPTTVSQGSSTTINYQIVGNANGQDTYKLTFGDVLTNDTGGTATSPTTSIQLGGTTLAAPAVAGATAITVPYDQTTDSNVNGIVVGSVIQIGANQYTVSAVAENTGGTAGNSSTITLSSAIVGATVATGTIVGQVGTFVVTVAGGSSTGSPSTEGISVTGQAGNGTGPSATSPTTTLTVVHATLTVTKYIATDGTGTTFLTAGAAAAPGTVLTYKIVAFNGGTDIAKNVTFTDLLPAYLTYKPNTGKVSTVGSAAAATSLTYPGAGAVIPDNSAGYTFSANTVGYTIGAAGTLAAGSALVLLFQATIN